MGLDRTAIVTGAGKRVGAAIAAALRDDGWTVIAHVRDAESPVPQGTVRAAADLSRSDCAERILAAAQGHPPLGLLVNNAARFAPDWIGEFDAGEFDRHMAVNLRAPALLTSAFARAVQSSGVGGALIVNLLDAKLASPNPDFASYTLSKIGLAGLTEIAARALAGRNIRVCGIAPALMLRSPGQSEHNFVAAHAHNPLRRGIDPEDVVRALRFLIDSPAITGEIITIDGGQRFMALPRDVQFLDLQERHG